MIRTVIMHQTVTTHDAIGNDIEKMYKILSGSMECRVFAENPLNQNVKYIDLEMLKKVASESENVLIYHHSIVWKLGEEILKQAKCRIIIKYHNITPAEFFLPYDSRCAELCKRGREQTIRLQQLFPDAFWLSDSAYNQTELEFVNDEKKGICAPFHVIDDWMNDTSPDATVLENIVHDKRLNILFVGRIAPNKGHLFMLEVLRCYVDNYGSDIILRIVGKRDQALSKYNSEIEERIDSYGLRSNVKFIGELTDETLLSYYAASDAFLCVSEHEGFCVPILEAQRCLLPIVARGLAAVPDTIGTQQIVLGEDPKQYAAALHELYCQEPFVDAVRALGMDNYKQYDMPHLEMKFKHYMNAWLGVVL